MPQRLTTLRLPTRLAHDIIAAAQRLCPAVAQATGDGYRVDIAPLHSQIGSGSLPVDLLPSAGLSMRPAAKGRGAGTTLKRLEEALRALPTPVIGHTRDGALFLDLRCLGDEPRFLAQLDGLRDLLEK